MNREIIFRGKRIDTKEWIEGYYGKKQRRCTSPYAPIMFDVHCIMKEIVLEDYSYFEDIEVIPETVGMWTGLTDKNGKKIFEGDVVKYCNYECEVKYANGSYSLEEKNGIFFFMDSRPNIIEVIGNKEEVTN